MDQNFYFDDEDDDDDEDFFEGGEAKKRKPKKKRLTQSDSAFPLATSSTATSTPPSAASSSPTFSVRSVKKVVENVFDLSDKFNKMEDDYSVVGFSSQERAREKSPVLISSNSTYQLGMGGEDGQVEDDSSPKSSLMSAAKPKKKKKIKELEQLLSSSSPATPTMSHASFDLPEIDIAKIESMARTSIKYAENPPPRFVIRHIKEMRR